MAYSRRGPERERQVRRLMERHGWWTSRAAGSHGESDIVALRAGFAPLLVQVKSDRAGACAHFGPEDRKALFQAAKKAGALPILLWWPPRRMPALYAVWPERIELMTPQASAVLLGEVRESGGAECLVGPTTAV